MNSNQVVEETTKIVNPILDKYNFELSDVEYVKEHGDFYLRVYIDKPGGINLEECAIVNGELSEKLDEVDLIDDAYFLEVSSPGLEKPLKTKEAIQNAEGEYINVSLYQKVNKSKVFEGHLINANDSEIELEYKDKNIKLSLILIILPRQG